MDSCGGFKRLYSQPATAVSAPEAVTLKELISTTINQGIFTTIVGRTAEWITVAHPKMIQDETISS
jgi:hypothetical protein